MIKKENHENIELISKELKLPYISKFIKDDILEANKENKTYDQFLYELLEKEYDLRKTNY